MHESATNVKFEKRENRYPIGAKSWNAAIDRINELEVALARKRSQVESYVKGAQGAGDQVMEFDKQITGLKEQVERGAEIIKIYGAMALDNASWKTFQRGIIDGLVRELGLLPRPKRSHHCVYCGRMTVHSWYHEYIAAMEAFNALRAGRSVSMVKPREGDGATIRTPDDRSIANRGGD